jgi:hypothetical protein
MKRSLDWGQGRNVVYRDHVKPTRQRRGFNGGGRRESAKGEENTQQGAQAAAARPNTGVWPAAGSG